MSSIRITLACTVLLALGCATPGFDPALDGRWKQLSMGCENGNDGPALKMTRKGRARDHLEGVTEIHGSNVTTHSRYWKTPEPSGPACEWTASEHWIRQPDGGFITKADDETTTNPCGVPATRSNGQLEHHYEVKDGKLSIYLGTPTDCSKPLAKGALRMCGCGARAVAIFERVP